MDPLAQRVAARFLKKGWDKSVLPVTEDELRDMDEDERREVLEKELNRAGDLLMALAEAFKDDLGSNQRAITQAARTTVQVARAVR